LNDVNPRLRPTQVIAAVLVDFFTQACGASSRSQPCVVASRDSPREFFRRLAAQAIVNAATPLPSLHRFVPRNAFETTSYGYEVIARVADLEDCLSTVHWIDCWCPDAAQFILLETPKDLSLHNSAAFFDAIERSHFAPKLRLICPSSVFEDVGLVEEFSKRQLGMLADEEALAHLEERTAAGVLGIRCNAIEHMSDSRRRLVARDLIRDAHASGLRVIASQSDPALDVREVLAIGFDYVSLADGGMRPVDTSLGVLYGRALPSRY
jgi:hypothetical protein